MSSSVPHSRLSRTPVLLALCLAGFAVTMTYTGIGVAVPAIEHDLRGSSIEANWVINAFVLAFGAFVMTAGAMADRYGRKRVMSIGIVLFSASSFAGALSTDIVFLDLMRAAQGIAAAFTMAASAAAVAHVFYAHERMRAFSLLGTSFGIGFASGPILIGLSVERFGWRAVFVISALLGMLVMQVMWLSAMPESKDPDATKFDWAGALTFMAMLFLFTDGLVEAPALGWSHPLSIGLAAGAAAMLVAFIAVEKMQRRPMLDLSLFRYSHFVGVQSLPIAAGFGFIAPLAVLPIRFVGAEGMTAAHAGLVLLPLCAPMTVVPLLAGYLARWIGPGVICAGGLGLSAIGLFLLASVPVGAGGSAFALPLIAIGVGVSMPWGLMDALAVSVVPKERAGMAVGIFGTMRLVSEGSAIAITLALLMGLMRMRLPAVAEAGNAANLLAMGKFREAATLVPSVTARQMERNYGDAFHTTFVILAVIVAVAAIVAFLTVRHSNQDESPETNKDLETLLCGHIEC